MELTNWIVYEQMEEERQIAMLRQAIVLAFNGDKKAQASPIDNDEEPVVDTTDPKFVEQFKGFTGTPQAQQQQPQRLPARGTQIIMG